MACTKVASCRQYFNVYMDDLSNILNKSGLGCHLGDVSVNNLLYADDTCILAPSPSALQRLLKLCELFACDNNVIFNAAKTKYMCLKTKTLKDLIVPDVLLSGNALTRLSVQKYLGVLISDDCQDDVDIKRHVRSLYSRGNSLVKRFRHCSVNVKNFLFKSFCSNIYGGQLWCNFKNESDEATVQCIVTTHERYKSQIHTSSAIYKNQTKPTSTSRIPLDFSIHSLSIHDILFTC